MTAPYLPPDFTGRAPAAVRAERAILREHLQARADAAAPPPEGTGACYSSRRSSPPTAAPHPDAQYAWHTPWALVVPYVLAALAALLAVLAFPGKASAQLVPAPQAVKYRADLVRAAHSQWGLDAPIAALAAQVHQESGWNPQAVSHVGAAGMAQFMPATAKWWCDMNDLSAAQCQPTNPTWALRALAGYDKYLYDRTPTRYSRFDRMWVALRGYNGGLGHWTAEARNAANGSRQAVDAACGTARRARVHCTENLGYPARILGVLQPRYATWGHSL